MTETEKLQQVRQNLLAQAEDIRQFLDESEETYFRNFQAEIVSARRVNVTWESNQEGLFDIEYYRPNRDREWQHSVARYREPIPIEDLQTSIGFNSDVVDVRLRAVKDGEVIQEFSAKKDEGEPETPKPALPDFESFEYKGIVLAEKDFTGGKFRTGGIAGNLMFMQSLHRLNGILHTNSTVFSTEDFLTWKPESNPVFTEFADWQGQSNGVAHRSGMLTGFKHQGKYYSYFQDRVGNYSGMRAPGVAVSDDGINWKMQDKPFFTVEDVKRIIPAKFFTADPVFTHGRVYIHHAESDQKHVYCSIRTIVNGKNEDREYKSFLIRGTDPMDSSSFEYLEQDERLRSFYHVGGKWIVLRNAGRDGVRGVGICMANSLSEKFEESYFLENHIGANPHKYILSQINGRYAILYNHRQDYSTHLLIEN